MLEFVQSFKMTFLYWYHRFFINTVDSSGDFDILTWMMCSVTNIVLLQTITDKCQMSSTLYRFIWQVLIINCKQYHKQLPLWRGSSDWTMLYFVGCQQKCSYPWTEAGQILKVITHIDHYCSIWAPWSIAKSM